MRGELVGLGIHNIESELIGILFGSPLRETANWMGPEIEMSIFYLEIKYMKSKAQSEDNILFVDFPKAGNPHLQEKKIKMIIKKKT